MNKQEIIEFLLDKPGYLKEGARRLSLRLGINPDSNYDMVKSAIREASVMYDAEEFTTDRESDLDMLKGMRVKSAWQVGDKWKFSLKSDEESKKLESFKLFQTDLIDSLKSISPVVDKRNYEKQNSPVAYEISLPDFHFGKMTGETLDQQADLFFNSVMILLDKASGLNIERIILPIGNDILNSEGMSRATTKGTPQTDNDGWQETFRVAWTSIIKVVNILETIAPVDIIIISGNHAYEREFYLGDVLLAYYYNNKNVTVDNSFEHRKYLTYGLNLIGYTHGDTEKPDELPLIMATEKPVEFANANTRHWRLGHLHKHMHDEYRGVGVTFLPSLCGNDHWHKKMGYYSERKAQGYIWNKKGGIEGYLQVNHMK